MPDPGPPGAKQRIIALLFPVLGTAALATGIVLAILTGGDSPLVFSVLGGSIVLFAVASALIGYRLFGPVKTALQPTLSAKPPADTKAATLPEIKPSPVPQIKIVPKETAKIPLLEGNTEFAKLMNMTLGEILLAAHLGNPEGAGGIVAEAVAKAGKSDKVRSPPAILRDAQ